MPHVEIFLTINGAYKMHSIFYNHYKKSSITCLLLISLYTFATSFVQAEQQNNLAPCPDSPNCINSEQGMIDPIAFKHRQEHKAWLILQQVITAQGGEITSVQDHYLTAVFTSSVFSFKDDLHARLDQRNKVIHLRSASQTGYYDFGANLNRLKKIRKNVLLRLNLNTLDNVQ